MAPVYSKDVEDVNRWYSPIIMGRVGRYGESQVTRVSHIVEGCYTCGMQVHSIISIRLTLDNACKQVYQVLADNHQQKYKSPGYPIFLHTSFLNLEKFYVSTSFV